MCSTRVSTAQLSLGQAHAARTSIEREQSQRDRNSYALRRPLLLLLLVLRLCGSCSLRCVELAVASTGERTWPSLPRLDQRSTGTPVKYALRARRGRPARRCSGPPEALCTAQSSVRGMAWLHCHAKALHWRAARPRTTRPRAVVIFFSATRRSRRRAPPEGRESEVQVSDVAGGAHQNRCAGPACRALTAGAR